MEYDEGWAGLNIAKKNLYQVLQGFPALGASNGISPSMMYSELVVRSYRNLSSWETDVSKRKTWLVSKLVRNKEVDDGFQQPLEYLCGVLISWSLVFSTRNI